MINLKKLQVFDRRHGDPERFNGTKDMSEGDFYEIDILLSDIHIIRQGLASKDYESQFQERLREKCENDKVIEALFELVKKYRGKDSV